MKFQISNFQANVTFEVFVKLTLDKFNLTTLLEISQHRLS